MYGTFLACRSFGIVDASPQRASTTSTSAALMRARERKLRGSIKTASKGAREG